MRPPAILLFPAAVLLAAGCTNPLAPHASDYGEQVDAERLRRIVAAVEAQGHGAGKEHCCVSAEYGECGICETYDRMEYEASGDGD